jgi:hypothetical protein
MTTKGQHIMRGFSAIDRFWAKTERRGECLFWTASKTRNGYGLFGFGDGTVSTAHRFIWSHHNGPIPEGMQIDHLCRNPSCVEISHLRLVTPSENQRAIPLSVACHAGHPWDEANTLICHQRNGTPYRLCRACARIRNGTGTRINPRMCSICDKPLAGKNAKAIFCGTICKQRGLRRRRRLAVHGYGTAKESSSIC